MGTSRVSRLGRRPGALASPLGLVGESGDRRKADPLTSGRPCQPSQRESGNRQCGVESRIPMSARRAHRVAWEQVGRGFAKCIIRCPFDMPKSALWRPERNALQPPQAARRRGGQPRRRWPSCTRPFPTRGSTGRLAAARRRPPGRPTARMPGTAARAAPWRTRPSPAAGGPPRQRLQPHRDPARLRPRQDAAAGERPRPARVRAGRGGQGDRGRAGGQVRGLDLQRPRSRARRCAAARASCCGSGSPTAPSTLTRSTSTASTRPPWTACPGSARVAAGA